MPRDMLSSASEYMHTYIAAGATEPLFSKADQASL